MYWGFWVDMMAHSPVCLSEIKSKTWTTKDSEKCKWYTELNVKWSTDSSQQQSRGQLLTQNWLRCIFWAADNMTLCRGLVWFSPQILSLIYNEERSLKQWMLFNLRDRDILGRDSIFQELSNNIKRVFWLLNRSISFTKHSFIFNFNVKSQRQRHLQKKQHSSFRELSNNIKRNEFSD